MHASKLLFLISLGAVLEYYDFAIFIYLAPVIGKALIPVQDPVTNLVLSFAIFAIGAFFRPLGGIIFAHIGDTRGRKNTFIYTILFMAVPTMLIAFIPSSNNIGICATILLLFFRIVQGFAIGGEIPGSTVFGYEIAPPHLRPLYSSIVMMGTNIGFFIASVICTILASVDSLRFDSWRIAFIIGGIFGIFSYFLRKSLSETPMFTEYKKSIEKQSVPIKALFKEYSPVLFRLLGITAFCACLLAVFTFYMPTYLSSFYNIPITTLLKFNSYTIIIFLSGSLTAGIFHRFFGKTFFIAAGIGAIIIAIVLFNSYAILSLTQILIIHSIILLMIGIISGRIPVICAAAFPVNVRYSGVALAYNISFGMIAGSTQMILTWLIKVTHYLWMPALYITIFSLLLLVALMYIPKRSLCEYN